MKKVKLLVSFAVTSSIVFGGFSTAFAKVDGYTVKDSKTSIIRQYDTKELCESFLDQSEGVGDGRLYKEFKKDSEENGIYTLRDSSRKYVDYKSALKQSEEQSENGQAFTLNDYLGDAKAEETPDYVYERKVKGGEVVSGLNITKDGFIADLSSEEFEDFEDVHITGKDIAVKNGTIKGELILDSEGLVVVKNVKGESIKAVAGDIHLTKVEAEQLEVKGNKKIKIESKEGTNIKNTKVESYAVIDSKAGTLGTVTISVDEKGDKTVELKGTFTEPVIIKSDIELKVDEDAKLAKVEIDTPKGAEVKLSGNVGEVEVKSETNIKVEEGTKAEITGTGEGEKSVIDADENTDIKVDGIEDITGDGADDVETGNTNTGDSGSSNSGSSTGQAENAALDQYISQIKAAIGILGSLQGNMTITGDNSTQINILDDNLKSKSLDQFIMSIVDRMLSKGYDDITVMAMETYLKDSANEITDTLGNKMGLNKYIANKLSGKPNSKAAVAYFNNPCKITFAALQAAIKDNAYTYKELLETIQEIIPFNSADKNVYFPKIKVRGLELSKIEIIKGNTATITPGTTVDIGSVKTELGISGENTTLRDLNGITFKFTFKGARGSYSYEFKLNSSN